MFSRHFRNLIFAGNIFHGFRVIMINWRLFFVQFFFYQIIIRFYDHIILMIAGVIKILKSSPGESEETKGVKIGSPLG